MKIQNQSEVIEVVKIVRGVSNVGWKGLDKEGHYTFEAYGDVVGGAGAGRNNASARAVLLFISQIQSCPFLSPNLVLPIPISFPYRHLVSVCSTEPNFK